MSSLRALSLVRHALAFGVALGLGGCDESQPPGSAALIHAVSSSDGDGQGTGVGSPDRGPRDQMQLYFGERFADEQKALLQQPQVAVADAPTF